MVDLNQMRRLRVFALQLALPHSPPGLEESLELVEHKDSKRYLAMHGCLKRFLNP